jgi:hypothetical protein
MKRKPPPLSQGERPVKKPKDNDDRQPPPTNKARWECLPATDSKWIRALLDGGSTCSLEAIPCMKDEKLMPLHVSNLLLAGRARVEFYACVRHARLCPRHLLLGNRIHCHRNHDNLAAVCITEDMKFEGKTIECVRLFVRCFSVKCVEQYQRTSQTSINWIELKPQHHLRFNSLNKHKAKEDEAAASAAEDT